MAAVVGVGQGRSLEPVASLAVPGGWAGSRCSSQSGGVPVKPAPRGTRGGGAGSRFHRRMMTIIGNGPMPCPPSPGNAGLRLQGAAG